MKHIPRVTWRICLSRERQWLHHHLTCFAFMSWVVFAWFCFWFVCFSTMRSGLIWFFFQQGLLWPRLALKSLCNTSDLEFLNLPPPASQGLVLQTPATTPLVALHQVFVLFFMLLWIHWGGGVLGRGMPMGLCACVYYSVHVEVKGQFAEFKSFEHAGSGIQTPMVRLGSKQFYCLTYLVQATFCFFFFNAVFTYGLTRTCFVERCQYAYIQVLWQRRQHPCWLRCSSCSSVSLADFSRRRPSLAKNEIGLW